MIASLQGIMQSIEGERALIETDGGVGYLVHVTAATLRELPPPGHRVRLHTELVVREDAWTLFGFHTADERIVFQRLLASAGVGPRLALAVLSELGASRAVRAIRERDIAVLSSVTGIGRKKAERLALELADRFDDLPVRAEPKRSGHHDDAVRALVALGYTTVAADDAVREAARDVALLETPQLIRQALALLTIARAGR